MEHRGIGKIKWFIRRFGVRELISKPLRVGVSPLVVPLLIGLRRSFQFNGETYDYCVRAYNTTWCNERAVEVPIVWRRVAATPADRILEVGNVLSHYHKVLHRVIDKYEGPEKTDVAELSAPFQYDLIVSISTFEHVGFDEQNGAPYKLQKALNNCLNALAPSGRLLFTAPVGYNPEMDRQLRYLRPRYMRRVAYCRWVESGELDPQLAYMRPYPYANQLAIVEMQR